MTLTRALTVPAFPSAPREYEQETFRRVLQDAEEQFRKISAALEAQTPFNAAQTLVAGGGEVPAGVWPVAQADAAALGSVRLYGPGQIQTADGRRRAPNFTAHTAAPSPTAAWDSIATAFDGDIDRVLWAYEERISGSATLGAPSAGGGAARENYTFLRETAAVLGFMDIAPESGRNASRTTSAGRTLAAFDAAQVAHRGNGDAAALWRSVRVSGSRTTVPDGLSALDWSASPAGTLLAGVTTAAAANVLLRGLGDIELTDQGLHDVAAIGLQIVLRRGVATGALGADWMGARIESPGAQSIGAFFTAFGKATIGAHLSAGDYGANQAAITLAQNQRIYGNATQADSIGLPRNATLGNDWITRSSSGWWAIHYNSVSCLEINDTLVTARRKINVSAATPQYEINGVKVVGARETGWTQMTGTALKSALATVGGATANGTYTQSQLQTVMDDLGNMSRRLKAHEDALFTHGLIGV